MTIEQRPGQASSLMEYLPVIFQEGSAPEQANFLGRFLLAFERILLGLGEVSQEIPEPGIEEILGGIVDPVSQKTLLAGVQRYFDPGARLPDGIEINPLQYAPAEFLPWLASWVALTLRSDWKEDQKRRFISRIVPLYQQRGTKKGLKELLCAYTGLPSESVEIYELTQALQVGKTATVGIDTAIGGGLPYYFIVRMSLPISNFDDRSRQEQIARSIIDQEKPAHTYYDLRVEFPTIQVGVTSTVGKDTLLGISPS